MKIGHQAFQIRALIMERLIVFIIILPREAIIIMQKKRKMLLGKMIIFGCLAFQKLVIAALILVCGDCQIANAKISTAAQLTCQEQLAL